MSVCCECCVLSRGLCDQLITRPEESSECGVSECDRGTSRRRPRPTGGLGAGGGSMYMYMYEGGSKSFRPDHLFKVTETKQLCYFSI
jgi:hypothetical protein